MSVERALFWRCDRLVGTGLPQRSLIECGYLTRHAWLSDNLNYPALTRIPLTPLLITHQMTPVPKAQCNLGTSVATLNGSQSVIWILLWLPSMVHRV